MSLLRPAIPKDSLHPWAQPLRDWQREACGAWWERKPTDFLACATPGAGKTLFASRLSHAGLTNGLVERIVVVVPRRHLKKQVARVFASSAGIQLEANFDNATRRVGLDYHGVAVTYQQIASCSQIFAEICQRPTMVILDEIHHAGEDATWAVELRKAFDNATYRLGMSGTPFRSDKQPIPFVRYENLQCAPDYTYDYSRALRDGVCRPIAFALLNGKTEWVSRDGTHRQAELNGEIKAKYRAEAMRTALSHEGWIGEALRKAHGTLRRLRATSHPEAGGLILALDQSHARELAALVERILGVRAALVISDEEQSDARLENFRNSPREQWMITVSKVSEGVDIPRLRVLLWASANKTMTYFHQALGRIVRADRRLGDEQRAYVIMPDVVALHPLIATVRNQVLGFIEERDRKRPEVKETRAESNGDPGQYRPLGATFIDEGKVHHVETLPLPIDLPAPKPIAITDRREDARKTVRRLVAQVNRRFKVQHASVYATLSKRCGGPISSATHAQLEKRVEELERWLRVDRYDGLR